MNEKDGCLHPIDDPKPNFKVEKSLLVQCMTEAGRGIKLMFDVATDERLQAAATRRCGCLHFLGHGYPNYLIFEDGRGGAHFLRADELLDPVHSEPFKLVFVSACPSSFMGRAFVNAGVPHVVCCDHEEELRDDAALAFTQAFYHALAEMYTVEAAFFKARSAVSKRFLREEAKKFLLLPEDGNHDEQIFDACEVEWNDENSMRQFFPEPPQHIVGREIDTYNLIQEILSKRIVTLIGEKGIGCSTLVASTCKYIAERKTTMPDIERIYFVRGGHGGVNDIHSFSKQLYDQLSLEGKVEKLGNRNGFELVFKTVLNALSTAKALVVIDGLAFIDRVLADFVNTLVETTNAVKVLMISQKSSHLKSTIIEDCVFNLGPLDGEASAKLFGMICPHTNTSAKQLDFFNLYVAKTSTGEWHCARDCTRRLYQTVSKGIPRRVVDFAKEIPAKDLHRLFLERLDRAQSAELFLLACCHHNRWVDCAGLRDLLHSRNAADTVVGVSTKIDAILRIINGGIPSRIIQAGKTLSKEVSIHFIKSGKM